MPRVDPGHERRGGGPHIEIAIWAKNRTKIREIGARIPEIFGGLRLSGRDGDDQAMLSVVLGPKEATKIEMGSQ